MKYSAAGAAPILLLSLFISVHSARADDSGPSPVESIRNRYEWAAGRMIDTVFVAGNRRVKDHAILREMESRVGTRLDLVSLERDQSYIGDIGVFVTVEINVEPYGDGACALRVSVTERPTLLLKLVYPVLEYDINSERLRYGIKWNDRNFRKRLQSFSVDAQRDNLENSSGAASWSTRWVGWKQLGAGARLSYFHRGQESLTLTIVEQTRISTALSIPLTDSRVRRMQVTLGLGHTDNRLGMAAGGGRDEQLVSPSVGFLFDSRDSPLKPRYGTYFFTSMLNNRDYRQSLTYHMLSNDTRWFHSLDEYTTLALYSRLDYQFGEFPDYIRFGTGGSGTLRGYGSGRFRGAHRWFQTAELRVIPWPKRVYRLPIAGLSDFQVAVVMFVDGGIAWTNSREFGGHGYHAGAGWGIRLYSPFQDAVRFDLGYNSTGSIHPYFSTGVRF